MSASFTPAQPHPELAERTIHVWRIPLASTDAAATRRKLTLSGDELQRAARFHFAVDRDRYTLGRSALRRLLGRYVGMAPEKLVFSYGSRGKPMLSSPSPIDTLEFNLSHRGDFALLAVVTGREIGVDIEQLREVPEALAIARNHFTPAESTLLHGARSPAERHEHFFRLWTRKEAVIKAVGTGLAMPLEEFEVSANTVDAAGWRTVAVPARPDTPWSVCDLALGPGYFGAICVAGPPLRLCYWREADE